MLEVEGHGVCIILIGDENLYVNITQEVKSCHLPGLVYPESSVMGNVEYLVAWG